MLATRFIIALCPATPIYFVKYDGSSNWITRVKSDACTFDTFDAAMAVARDINGWGGTQRVEQVAVEVEDTRQTLDTPKARIEVRDLATATYANATERGDCHLLAAEEVASELRDLGLKARFEARNGASSPISLYLADHLGNTLTLDWDPMVDGFDYPTSGDDGCDLDERAAQREPEPDDTATCDGCENAFPVDEVEVCGSAEHGPFGFCKACRAKDAKGAAEPTDFSECIVKIHGGIDAIDAVLGKALDTSMSGVTGYYILTRNGESLAHLHTEPHMDIERAEADAIARVLAKPEPTEGRATLVDRLYALADRLGGDDGALVSEAIGRIAD